MAKGRYAIVDGTTRKVKKRYAIIDGVTRKIKKRYAIVDGKTRLVWGASEGKFILSGASYQSVVEQGGGYLITMGSNYTMDSDSNSIDINTKKGMLISAVCSNGAGRTIMTSGTSIYYSDDLLTWTKCSDGSAYAYNNTTNMFVTAKYLNNQFVVLCNAYYIAVSTDGITWNYIKVWDSSYSLESIAYGNGKYVISTSSDYLLYSNTLSGKFYQNNLSDRYYPIEYNPQDKLFIGYNMGGEDYILTSDGNNITKKTASNHHYVKYVNDRLFIYRSYFLGYATTDSNVVTTINSLSINDICYGDGVYLILCIDPITSNSTLYTSTDLITFTPMDITNVIANEPTGSYRNYYFHTIGYSKLA